VSVAGGIRGEAVVLTKGARCTPAILLSIAETLSFEMLLDDRQSLRCTRELFSHH
jgi:hypothetical protein